MKALFVHDNRFHRYGDQYFSTGLNAIVFKRYLKVFDSLIICGREVDHSYLEKPKGSLASIPHKIEFSNIKDKNAIGIWFSNKDRTHIKSLVNRVDFVIARLDSIIGFIAIEYARQRGLPYVIELCTDPWDCYINYGIKGKILAPIITYKTKLEVKRAKNVVYVTNEYLQSKYPCVNNTVSISNVECVPLNILAQNKFQKYCNFKKGDPIVLGTAGALLPFKGQRFVFEALYRLREDGYSNFKYRLAGEGSDKEKLQYLASKLGIQDMVEFCGSLNSTEMNSFYESLDIYIQPSLQEGLPRTVIEAMSRGLFCLGSRTAGIPELLSDFCIFPKKGVAEIVNLIKKVDSPILIEESIKNFNESKKYKSDVLESRRTKFFQNIISSDFNKDKF